MKITNDKAIDDTIMYVHELNTTGWKKVKMKIKAVITTNQYKRHRRRKFVDDYCDIPVIHKLSHELDKYRQ